MNDFAHATTQPELADAQGFRENLCRLLIEVLHAAVDDALLGKAPPGVKTPGPASIPALGSKGLPPEMIPPPGGIHPATVEAVRWFFDEDRRPPDGEGHGIAFEWLHETVIYLDGSLPSKERIRAHLLDRLGIAEQIRRAAA